MELWKQSSAYWLDLSLLPGKCYSEKIGIQIHNMSISDCYLSIYGLSVNEIHEREMQCDLGLRAHLDLS